MNYMLIHTIAAVILKLAYLGVGLLLCFIGERLLVKGVYGQTTIEGEIAGGKWKLLTASPGIVFALCGLGIVLYAIVTPLTYEEGLHLSQDVNESSGTQAHEKENQHREEITSTKKSQLFDEQSAGSALRSRVAIYALQHKTSGLNNQDVTSDINQMPIKADAEPWPRTYERFRNILKKNPSALSKILFESDRKSTRLNSSHRLTSRMPSSA
jgi:hypothetical protein